MNIKNASPGIQRLFKLRKMFIKNAELSVQKASQRLRVSKRTIERDIRDLYDLMDYRFSYDKRLKKYRYSDDIPEKDIREIYDFAPEKPLRKNFTDRDKKIKRYVVIIQNLLRYETVSLADCLDDSCDNLSFNVSLRTLQRDFKNLPQLVQWIKYNKESEEMFIDKRLMPAEWKKELDYKEPDDEKKNLLDKRVFWHRDNAGRIADRL